MQLLLGIIWLTKIERMSFLERQLADLLIWKTQIDGNTHLNVHTLTGTHIHPQIAVFQAFRCLNNGYAGPREMNRHVTFYLAQKQSDCPSSLCVTFWLWEWVFAHHVILGMERRQKWVYGCHRTKETCSTASTPLLFFHFFPWLPCCDRESIYRLEFVFVKVNFWGQLGFFTHFCWSFSTILLQVTVLHLP